MDGADDNEGACGACKRVGELICCEGCPAAFHCRCAGYGEASSSCLQSVVHAVERRHRCLQPLMMVCRRLNIAESPAEVPEGDWYCWFCAKERNLPYQHPRSVVSTQLPAGDLL
jgi:hypothetical protein